MSNRDLYQHILERLREKNKSIENIEDEQLELIVKQELSDEKAGLSEKETGICIAYIKQQLSGGTVKLKRIQTDTTSPAQVDRRILRAIKSTLASYEGILTEDYLKFVYDEVVMFDNSLWLSQEEKEDLFNTIKSEFPVDYAASSQWKAVTPDFESRVIHATLFMLQITEGTLSDIDIRLAFIDMIDGMIAREFVLVPTSKRKKLLESIKQQYRSSGQSQP